MTSDGDKAAIIRYHVYWPSSSDPFYNANQTEVKARLQYYPPWYSSGGQWGYVTPFLHIDGKKSGFQSSGWKSKILSRYNVVSPLTINLSGNYNDSTETGTVNATINNTSANSLTGKLHFVVTETNISRSGAPNGEKIHNQVFRDMIPTATGEAITIPAGGSLERSENFTLKNTWTVDDCEVIVFVQNNEMTKDSIFEVYQAAKIKVSDLPPLGIETVDNPITHPLRLSAPEPSVSSGSVILEYALPGDGTVHLTVYNLIGERIKTLVSEHKLAGTHRARWNGRDEAGRKVPAGVYIFQLEFAGITKFTRAVVAR